MRFYKVFISIGIIALFCCSQKEDSMERTQDQVSAMDSQFVTFKDSNVYYKGDNSLQIALEFTIDPGYHIQPEQLKGSNFIATAFHLEASDFYSIKDIHFHYRKTQWSFDNIEYFDVISGSFTVLVDLSFSRQTIWNLSYLDAALFYQACDDRQCFFPRELLCTVALN